MSRPWHRYEFSRAALQLLTADAPATAVLHRPDSTDILERPVGMRSRAVVEPTRTSTSGVTLAILADAAAASAW